MFSLYLCMKHFVSAADLNVCLKQIKSNVKWQNAECTKCRMAKVEPVLFSAGLNYFLPL